MPYQVITVNGAKETSMTPDSIDERIIGYYEDFEWISDTEKTEYLRKYPVYKTLSIYPDGSKTEGYSFEDPWGRRMGATKDLALSMVR